MPTNDAHDSCPSASDLESASKAAELCAAAAKAAFAHLGAGKPGAASAREHRLAAFRALARAEQHAAEGRRSLAGIVGTTIADDFLVRAMTLMVDFANKEASLAGGDAVRRCAGMLLSVLSGDDATVVVEQLEHLGMRKGALR